MINGCSVSFDFISIAPPVQTYCYAWARTDDLSIADVPRAECEDKDVTFSLLRVVDTDRESDIKGYNFDLRCSHPGGVLLGTQWLPRSDVLWAESGGLQVELYVGEKSMTIHNVTELSTMK